MGAPDAGIAESLSDKLTLGYSDTQSVGGLAFLQTLSVVTTVEHGCCS